MENNDIKRDNLTNIYRESSRQTYDLDHDKQASAHIVKELDVPVALAARLVQEGLYTVSAIYNAGPDLVDQHIQSLTPDELQDWSVDDLQVHVSDQIARIKGFEYAQDTSGSDQTDMLDASLEVHNSDLYTSADNSILSSSQFGEEDDSFELKFNSPSRPRSITFRGGEPLRPLYQSYDSDFNEKSSSDEESPKVLSLLPPDQWDEHLTDATTDVNTSVDLSKASGYGSTEDTVFTSNRQQASIDSDDDSAIFSYDNANAIKQTPNDLASCDQNYASNLFQVPQIKRQISLYVPKLSSKEEDSDSDKSGGLPVSSEDFSLHKIPRDQLFSPCVTPTKSQDVDHVPPYELHDLDIQQLTENLHNQILPTEIESNSTFPQTPSMAQDTLFSSAHFTNSKLESGLKQEDAVDTNDLAKLTL